MVTVQEILNTIAIPNEGLVLKKKDVFYWGKSSGGDIVYGIESKNKNLMSMTQTTRYLKICLNTRFNVSFGDLSEQKNLSLIILKQEGIKFLDIFIRLTDTIDSELSDQELLAYFLNLKDLFSNDSKKSIKELQGLYGELYAMVYLKEKEQINIAQFYQSEDKRKFDFSIDDSKKIEVKTTTLPARIHHFKLDQLNVLRYDILVVSIMLQKDDGGLSLNALINKAKDLFSNNLKLLIHIENMVKNIDVDVLETLKYNKSFIDENIKFVKAINIPRIQEKTMDGVFNVEFDSDLSDCEQFSDSEISEWISLVEVQKH